eukprot:TRINITY_DN21162_c0_g1_i1.p1 TRINITY_DN21162_c0_g1~~TRINITY_DN21162_c0_g1_i1.p1  ORF type:complete len:215 (+),score=52.64 TRINITY_DN21162_c0_g1_i1:56-646(+)
MRRAAVAAPRADARRLFSTQGAEFADRYRRLIVDAAAAPTGRWTVYELGLSASVLLPGNWDICPQQQGNQYRATPRQLPFARGTSPFVQGGCSLALLGGEGAGIDAGSFLESQLAEQRTKLQEHESYRIDAGLGPAAGAFAALRFRQAGAAVDGVARAVSLPGAVWLAVFLGQTDETADETRSGLITALCSLGPRQ